MTEETKIVDCNHLGAAREERADKGWHMEQTGVQSTEDARERRLLPRDAPPWSRGRTSGIMHGHHQILGQPTISSQNVELHVMQIGPQVSEELHNVDRDAGTPVRRSARK